MIQSYLKSLLVSIPFILCILVIRNFAPLSSMIEFFLLVGASTLLHAAIAVTIGLEKEHRQLVLDKAMSLFGR